MCGGSLTPELRLHLLTPACPLYSAPAPPQDHPLTRAGDPWWAVYWPGGQVPEDTIIYDIKSFDACSRSEI